MSQFPAYQTAGIAARWGCFSCLSTLDPAKTQDTGYPSGRGQWAIQCDKLTPGQQIRFASDCRSVGVQAQFLTI